LEIAAAIMVLRLHELKQADEAESMML